jgi:hypothetical protein
MQDITPATVAGLMTIQAIMLKVRVAATTTVPATNKITAIIQPDTMTIPVVITPMKIMVPVTVIAKGDINIMNPVMAVVIALLDLQFLSAGVDLILPITRVVVRTPALVAAEEGAVLKTEEAATLIRVMAARISTVTVGSKTAVVAVAAAMVEGAAAVKVFKAAAIRAGVGMLACKTIEPAIGAVVVAEVAVTGVAAAVADALKHAPRRNRLHRPRRKRRRRSRSRSFPLSSRRAWTTTPSSSW